MSTEAEISEQDHEYELAHEDQYSCTIIWDGQEIPDVQVMARWGTTLTASNDDAAIAEFEKIVAQAFENGPPENSDIFLAFEDGYDALGIPPRP